MNVLFILMGLVTETIWAIGCSIYAASIGNIFTPPGKKPSVRIEQTTYYSF